MSNSDPLGDMLTRIRNAQRARHSMCMAPASKLEVHIDTDEGNACDLAHATQLELFKE